MNKKQEIAILDFGSQYTHLIARKIREIGVRSHIYPNDVSANNLNNAVGIIFSGGPRSIKRDPKLNFDENIFSLNIPVLGLCYGHQLIADYFKGQIESGEGREYGISKLHTSQTRLFKEVPEIITAWMSHSDYVSELPPNFKQVATTGNKSIAAMENEQKNIFSLQFHPEVHHTPYGKTILTNFILSICKAEQNWNKELMIEEIIEYIKKTAQDKHVFLLISGGVDSTVCFTLLEKTLGKDRVYGLHVDHGLMRKNESEKVKKALEHIGLDDLHVHNAEKECLELLHDVADPEKKREIIGNFFIDIAEQVLNSFATNEKEWLIGQGTIYPDTIESGGTDNADRIKTHHNRVDRIHEMIKKGLVIEPIKDLYKDEVRIIGKKYDLPDSLIDRHPFPGPGLAIRCLCSDDSDKKPEKINHEIWKLPFQSVGVQGDERTYAHPALLIIDDSHDIDWQSIEGISPQITNGYENINRVLINVWGDKDKITECIQKKSYLTKDRLDILREMDEIVNSCINNEECSHIWQMPVVLAPFGYTKHESIILRPVGSIEAMTVNWAKIPENVLNKIIDGIKSLKAVDYIFYDVTNKPPGTIEWE